MVALGQHPAANLEQVLIAHVRVRACVRVCEWARACMCEIYRPTGQACNCMLQQQQLSKVPLNLKKLTTGNQLVHKAVRRVREATVVLKVIK